MLFKQLDTPGIALFTYVVGDESSGTAAVVDPRPGADVYLRIARDYNVTITNVFETHIHADFMSGGRELAARLGDAAKLYVSGEGGAEYGFDAEKVRDGDEFEFGSVRLVARHTPGHTPEHLSFEVAESDRRKKPWAVLTGDSLFVGSAGRPDLLSDEQTEPLVEQLFHTLRDYYLKLDDATIIYPGHGSGSACGADIGERPMGTIGFERRSNKFLQIDSLAEFKKFVRESAPPEPRHYKHLKKINAKGPPLLGSPPSVPGLKPQEFHDAVARDKYQLLDTRSMLAFGGGHIPGALSIPDRPELSVWAGQMLYFDRPILLVLDDDRQLERIVWHLVYTGFTRFAGYLVGGMDEWTKKGLELHKVPQMSVHEVKSQRRHVQVLDVRSPQEFREGRIPHARHCFVADMFGGVNGVADLDPLQPIVTYCGSGYRASIAASILKQNDYQDVRNMPGSWEAWKNAGFEIEKEK